MSIINHVYVENRIGDLDIKFSLNIYVDGGGPLQSKLARPCVSNTGYLGHILKSVVPFGSKINGFSSLRSLFATLVRS